MTKLARGIRNNNPGNLRNSDSVNWKGEVPRHKKKDDAFEEFERMEDGVRAMMKLLGNYQKPYKLNTLSELITRYAPPGDGNDTAAYIRRVSTEMQIPHNLPLFLEDKATMCALVDAMAFVENGMRVSPENIQKGWDLL